MSSYSLHPYIKGGHFLLSRHEFIVEESMPDHFSVYMTDSLVKDGSAIYFRYRLHTSDVMRFTDTLEYDIQCPRCSDKLRLCGMPADAYTHGLYKCPTCDEREERSR